jgi:hypothetical protein
VLFSRENEIIFVILTHWRLLNEMDKEMILEKEKNILLEFTFV